MNGHNSAKSKYLISKIEILLGLLFFGARVSFYLLGFKRLFLPDIQGLGSSNRSRVKNLHLKTHLLWSTHGLNTNETADGSSWGGELTDWQGKQWALCNRMPVNIQIPQRSSCILNLLDLCSILYNSGIFVTKWGHCRRQRPLPVFSPTSLSWNLVHNATLVLPHSFCASLLTYSWGLNSRTKAVVNSKGFVEQLFWHSSPGGDTIHIGKRTH